MRRSRERSRNRTSTAETPPRAAKQDQDRQVSTPLPDVFPLTDDMRTWATTNAPSLDVDREHQKFCDCYRATGKRMANWQARWTGWIRESQDRMASQLAESAQAPTPAAALWTPEAPPPEVANDPDRYREWMREQHRQHREAS